MQNWLKKNPEIRTIRVIASDLNGVARGKRVPARYADKIIKDGTRFPMSALNLDIWGEDIQDSALVMESGDQDGVLLPTGRGFVPMPWLNTPTGLLPVWMYRDDGLPFLGDPRHALAEVQNRFKAKGYTPVVGVELEFFLIDDTGEEPQMPVSPLSGKRRIAGEILSSHALDMFDNFFTELYDACDKMDIPADAAISESGLGQFEINLLHQPNALKAADDAWLFKILVKGIARKNGFAASFMAKPYPNYAGSGLHMHFSVLDHKGLNIFDNSSAEGSAALHNAVQGCLSAMPGSMLIFAPHANSYARLVPEAHAPTSVAWAYENRTVAIRIPSGPPKSRRIEHRLPGGDVNPYLSVAVILGAALNGIEDGVEAPTPITGNAYTQKLPQVPETWDGAITSFEKSDQVARILNPELMLNFLSTKRQEASKMADLSPEQQIEIYLDSV